MNKNSYHKIFWALVYVIAGLCLIFFNSQKIFNFKVPNNSFDFLYLYLWVLCSGVICFGINVIFGSLDDIQKNKKSESPYWSYFLYYPLILIISSGLIFSFLSLLIDKIGVVFYIASFVMAGYFGKIADITDGMILHFLKKIDIFGLFFSK